MDFFYGLALSEETLFSAKFVKIPFKLLMIDNPRDNLVSSGHLRNPPGWPLDTGSTVSSYSSAVFSLLTEQIWL